MFQFQWKILQSIHYFDFSPDSRSWNRAQKFWHLLIFYFLYTMQSPSAYKELSDHYFQHPLSYIFFPQPPLVSPPSHPHSICFFLQSSLCYVQNSVYLEQVIFNPSVENIHSFMKHLSIDRLRTVLGDISSHSQQFCKVGTLF